MRRRIIAGATYHIYSRGNQKMVIFKDKQDYCYFLKKLAFYKSNMKCMLFAYCLMPNHFHFLLREPDYVLQPELSEISRFMSRILCSYSKYFCLKYKHSGHVFQGRFNDKIVDKPDYYKTIIRYIHDNPLRKGLVQYRPDWPYSSAFKGHKLLLCDNIT